MTKSSLRLVAGALLLLSFHARASWTESIKVKGDARFRTESITDETTGTKKERVRQRVRARLGTEAQVADNVKATLRLATGEPVSGSTAGDIGSTNQSLDNYGTKKPIWLDLAYLDWSATEQVSVYAGKMPTPFYQAGKSDLIFDHDLTPEGMALRLKHDQEAFSAWVSGASLWLDETSSNANDVIMYGGQLGVGYTQEQWSAKLGFSSYNFSQIKGAQAVSAAGNSVVTVGTDSFYLFDYKLTNYFLEVGFNAGECPVVLYADAVSNSEATDAKDGILYGVRLGKSKAMGDWSFDLSFREVRADATLGVWTDSDSWGGGTDGKGYRAALGYMAADRVGINLTQYSNEKPATGTTKPYARTQLDVAVTF